MTKTLKHKKVVSKNALSDKNIEAVTFKQRLVKIFNVENENEETLVGLIPLH